MKKTYITKALADKINVPLKTSFAISKGAINNAENIYVRLTDSKGNQGLGEAAPFPVLTYDDQNESYQQIQHILERISGKTLYDSFKLLYGKDFRNTYSSITAFVAVEAALLDLRARNLEIPMSSLFDFKGINDANKNIITDITLPIMNESEVKPFWNIFADHKFPYVKVKVGHESVTADVHRILELRNIVGKEVKISLDGNQGCTVESAIKMTIDLAMCGIVPLFFEQPLPQDDWRGMAELTQKCCIPICADETVKTVQDAAELIARNAAHMVNLKIMKSGIAETLQIAQIIHASGRQLMIGGMVESEIAMTLSMHLYCGTGIIKWCDLDTPFFFTKSLTKQNPWNKKSAALTLPEGNGLALDWSDDE